MPTIDKSSATAAKLPTISAIERGTCRERLTSASIVAGLVSATLESSCRSTVRIAPSVAAGSSWVRTTRYRDGLDPFMAQYMVPASGASSPAYLTLLTTPITRNHGQLAHPPS